MKAINPICCTLLVLTAALLGARAESLRTDINPALLYYRAMLAGTEPLSEADRDYLRSKKGLEQKLPDRFDKIVASYDAQFRLVRHAAQSKVPCDWGLDMNEGPAMILPHLARAKAVALAAQLRTRWALQHGRQDDARDDLAAAFVLGRNVATDGLMISALVQCLVESLVYATVAQHFGEFSPETLRQLLERLDAAPPRHSMAVSIASEKELADWMNRKVLELRKAHPNDDAAVMAGFRDSGLVAGMESVGEKNFWSRVVVASGGTSEGLLKLLREHESLFPRLAELMALPPAEYATKATQFSAEIAKSPNPFVSAVGFILDKWSKQGFRPTEFRAQAELAMVHAAVEYKLHGPAGLAKVTDPFGNGPFSVRRFVLKGVDRGFELRSAYDGLNAPFVLIFVEKQGAPFHVSGPDAGKLIAK